MFAVASSTPARCAAPAASVRAKSTGAARSRACFAGSRVQARSELRMQSGRKSSVECRAAAEKGEMVRPGYRDIEKSTQSENTIIW